MSPVQNYLFKVGDRVANGMAKAVVVQLIADDALSVIYDGADKETTEMASSFRLLSEREDPYPNGEDLA